MDESGEQDHDEADLLKGEAERDGKAELVLFLAAERGGLIDLADQRLLNVEEARLALELEGVDRVPVGLARRRLRLLDQVEIGLPVGGEALGVVAIDVRQA